MERIKCGGEVRLDDPAWPHPTSSDTVGVVLLFSELHPNGNSSIQGRAMLSATSTVQAWGSLTLAGNIFSFLL